VAELCQISPFQATRLLQRLVKERKLVARDGKRNLVGMAFAGTGIAQKLYGRAQ